MAVSIIDRVQEFAARNQLWPGRGEIIVGFSGGADSTALLLLLQACGKAVRAVHLHHGLRDAAADADQDWCKTFCADRDIPFETHHLDVPAARETGESVEMAARRCRLEHWQEHVAPDTIVALGHHLDDQLETALIRFCRGCNASGLIGMRPRTCIQGVTLIRPLLVLTRVEIESYLRANKVTDWCRDASNADSAFVRNRLRHEIIPRLQALPGNPYNTLRYLQQDADFLDAAAADVNIDPLTVGTLTGLHAALLPRVMRNWLRQQMDDEPEFGEAAVGSLLDALAQGDGLVDIGGSWFIRISHGVLSLEAKQPPALRTKYHWLWQQQPELEIPELNLQLTARRVNRARFGEKREFFPAAALGEALVVRPRRPGDRMVPFGADSERRLKKLIADTSLSPVEKLQLVVICREDGEILWVPGVRRSQVGAVGADTPEIIELRVQ